MVQIFQQLPNPGHESASRISEAFGGGLSQGIAAGLNQMLQQKQNQRALAGLAPFLQQAGLIPEEISQFVGSGLDPKTAVAALKTVSAPRAKAQEAADLKKIGQESLDRISELVHKGNVGFGSKISGKVFGGETAEDVGEFESLTGALEAMLVDKVSRGTLSNARFKYITETLLPKPNDRIDTIKGKIKALRRELELEEPNKSKKLTTEKAHEILKQAKGDKEKARKIAKVQGYEF